MTADDFSKTTNSSVYPGLVYQRVHVLQFVFLAVSSTVLTWALQPRIGVRDVDAVSYIVGAYSIQDGQGYTDLSGNTLIHWPPGYSYLLAFWAEPLQAALVINYSALGVAIGLLYFLALSHKWPWQAALGFSLAIGFGFLREMATNAKPEILTYAFFLLAVALYTIPTPEGTLVSYCVWALLIPLKYIAVIFLPAAILADCLTERPTWRTMLARYWLSVLLWGLVLASLLILNFLSSGAWLPPTHPNPTLATLPLELVHFLISIPRQLLSNWYGSIQTPATLIAFLIPLICALACGFTLRLSPESRRLQNLGVAVLLCSALLLSVKEFDATVRLMGYGVLLVILSLRPLWVGNKLWLIYAIASLAIGIINGVSTNALGDNDLRYANMARSLSAVGLPAQVIYSNSFHILDIHIRHASQPETDVARLKSGSYFFWVNLPNYDAVATTVMPIPPLNRQWCQITAVEGGGLYYKCR